MNAVTDLERARHDRNMAELRAMLDAESLPPDQAGLARLTWTCSKLADHVVALYGMLDKLSDLVEDAATRSDLDDLRAELLGTLGELRS